MSLNRNSCDVIHKDSDVSPERKHSAGLQRRVRMVTLTFHRVILFILLIEY